MLKNQQLMSQKEKDYIASCFNRTANSLKTEINYEDILNGEKIEYDLKDARKEFKRIFGKAYRRSRKHFRPASNTESRFMECGHMINQLYETLSILKYLKLDDETFLEIGNSLAIHFENSFSLVINNSKAYDFLAQFFTICPEQIKLDIVKVFYKNPECIENSLSLFEFLDKNLKIIPVNAQLIKSNLWNSNSGCLLGLFLLLKDQSLSDRILQAFIASKVLDCEYLQKFLSVLLSLCDNEQKKAIHEKLKKEKLAKISAMLNNLDVNK